MKLSTCVQPLMRTAPFLNTPVTAMANSRTLGWIVGRNLAVITYTGRRSGRTISTPVAYRRHGDGLQITANMPDAKTWWRNFLGQGAPLSVRIDGVEREGYAVSRRDAAGRVTVDVQLG